MKISYWSPFLTNIATIKSVIRSAKSITKYKKSKNVNNVKILNASGEWDNYRSIPGVKIENMYPFSFHKFLPKTGFIQSRFAFLIISIFNFFPLLFKIKKDKPDFLIIHLLTFLPIILSPFLSKNTKIILRVSGLPKLTFFRKFVWRLFSSYIFKITVPTKKTLEILKNSKIFDLSKINLLRDPAIDQEEILKNKNKPIPKVYQNKKYLLSTGRLTQQKNFSFLIKMFIKYKKLTNADFLLIIGDGEKKKDLQKLISASNFENYIHLIGFKKNVYNYIKNSEAIISTAEYEDPGFVLLESAYLKKKIVTSLVANGPIEMKKSGDFCLFFKLNNEKSFVNALIKLKNKNTNKINKAKNYSKKFLTNQHLKNLLEILN